MCKPDLLLTDNDVALRALNIIQSHLNDLPVGQARRILRQSEMMIDATTRVNSNADDFHLIYEEFLHADS